MVIFAVRGVGGVAEFGYLGAAFGVYGEGRWGDVRGVEGEEGTVEGVEVVQFGGGLGGWFAGEGDGF